MIREYNESMIKEYSMSNMNLDLKGKLTMRNFDNVCLFFPFIILFESFVSKYLWVHDVHKWSVHKPGQTYLTSMSYF